MTTSEQEEFELDADSLKPTMLKHLEVLMETIRINRDDLDELRKILARVSADRIMMYDIEAKLTAKIGHLANYEQMRDQIKNALNTAIGMRK